MSIISYAEAEAFLDDELSEGNLDFPLLCDAVDQYIKTYCKRTFDSTSYTEYHSGNGLPNLYLDDIPVTAIERVAVGRTGAIRVCNTNTSSTASVSVTTTGVVLTYNGTSDSTCLFATYTTMTTLVAAINAISGWAAELGSSEYGDYLSTELIPSYGKSCIKSQYVDLEIPYEAEYDFEVDADTGILTATAGWTRGTRNIRVDYTAGYAEADMPDDLKTAAKIIVKDWWEKRSESTFNITGYSVGGMTKQIEAVIPKEALAVLASYRRYKV